MKKFILVIAIALVSTFSNSALALSPGGCFWATTSSVKYGPMPVKSCVASGGMIYFTYLWTNSVVAVPRVSYSNATAEERDRYVFSCSTSGSPGLNWTVSHQVYSCQDPF